MIYKNMKKNILWIALIFSFGVFILVGCMSNDSDTKSDLNENKTATNESTNITGDSINDNPPNISEDNSVSIPDLHLVTWVELDGGTNEISMINNSDLIVRGIVTGSNVQIIEGGGGAPGVPFTHSSVDIKEIYGIDSAEVSILKSSINEKNQVIEVRQTGDEDYLLSEAPLIEIGKEYLFFLTKRPEDPYFSPVGGRLGIAEISSSGNLKFTNMTAATMGTNFQGKNIKNIKESFEILEGEVDSNIIFSTNPKVLAKELGWKEKSLKSK